MPRLSLHNNTVLGRQEKDCKCLAATIVSTLTCFDWAGMTV